MKIEELLKVGLVLGLVYLLIPRERNQEKNLLALPFSGLKDIVREFENKLPKEALDRLVEIAKSITPENPSRYLRWIILRYIENKDDPDILEKLREYVSAFDFYRKRRVIKGEEADIYRYKTLDEFIKVVEKARTVETRSMLRAKRKKGIGLESGKDYVLVYSDKNGELYEILTYNASCYFGQGTKWCISMEKESQHWKHYAERQGSAILFLILKDGRKYAFIFPQARVLGAIVEAYVFYTDKLELNLPIEKEIVPQDRLLVKIFEDWKENEEKYKKFWEEAIKKEKFTQCVNVRIEIWDEEDKLLSEVEFFEEVKNGEEYLHKAITYVINKYGTHIILKRELKFNGKDFTYYGKEVYECLKGLIR